MWITSIGFLPRRCKYKLCVCVCDRNMYHRLLFLANCTPEDQEIVVIDHEMELSHFTYRSVFPNSGTYRCSHEGRCTSMYLVISLLYPRGPQWSHWWQRWLLSATHQLLFRKYCSHSATDLGKRRFTVYFVWSRTLGNRLPWLAADWPRFYEYGNKNLWS